MSKPKFLETERIYLRELRKEDAHGNYYHWLNDAEISQYLDWLPLIHSEEPLEMIKNLSEIFQVTR